MNELKPVACVDLGVLNWVADMQIEGPADLYAIPDTHRVVSVELLKAYQSAIEAGQFMGFDEEYEQMQAIIDNKGE